MNFKVIIVDCSGVTSEDEFWEAYVRDVNSPHPGFGRNLDAFADSLWGGPGAPVANEVRFVGTASLEALRQGRFLALLKDLAHDAPDTRITFE
ncbi:barstar family protein [Deinococcus pimensis]|uniref:barstar family protein n=1 Tax=Deinococcus pimensis TaxID=309888 RepID=UPI0004B82574|nr:barstar family protein [Deinococcus pimensis]